MTAPYSPTSPPRCNRLATSYSLSKSKPMPCCGSIILKATNIVQISCSPVNSPGILLQSIFGLGISGVQPLLAQNGNLKADFLDFLPFHFVEFLDRSQAVHRRHRIARHSGGSGPKVLLGQFRCRSSRAASATELFASISMT